MAYVQISSTNQWVGISTATKPSGSGVEIGSLAIEYDTGNVYRTPDGGTTWALVKQAVDVQASSGIGSLTETAPATDNAPSGLNGRLQRIAQRLTSLIGLIPTALGANGGMKVEGVANGVAQPVTVGAGTASIGATKDDGSNWTSVFGVSAATVVSADITTATAVTDAPTSGQKIVITDIVVSTDTAMNILFEEETSGTDIFKIFLPANGLAQITTRGKVKLATANKKLTAKASVAGNVGITVCYHSEL